jgi:predicted TIM-barrel fold metal-dependent hydrolase
MDRLKFIDADSHVMEPEDLWNNYLEEKYRHRVKAFTDYKRDPGIGETGMASGKDTAGDGQAPLGFGIEVTIDDVTMPFDKDFAKMRVEMPGLGDSYEQLAEQQFPPSAYKQIMENSGIDYMVVYPTVALYTGHAPQMDKEPEFAQAMRRAYNTWLGDFTRDAGGRVFGAAGVDLRDPAASAIEVRRTVEEYGFKAIHLQPTPVGDHRLYDEICDPLWSELEDLDIPVGIHPGAGNAMDVMIYHYLPNLPTAQGTVAFAMGNMLACAGFIMGGVLERHPKLRVTYLEAGAGWTAYWLERLASSVNGGFRGLEIPGLTMHPIEYFQRQCFISSEQDDPGIKQAIDVIGDDNIVTATDFCHPEGRRYGQAAEMLMDLPGVSVESKRKIMWDNALKLYPIKPAN